MIVEEKNTNTEQNQFTHYVGIAFNSSTHSYNFGSNNLDLKIDDPGGNILLPDIIR